MTIDRHDIWSSQKADILIAQHVISLALSGKSVYVVCDDTYSMCSCFPVKDRTVVDIRATAEVHYNIAADLLAIHGLYGTDTIALLHGRARKPF